MISYDNPLSVAGVINSVGADKNCATALVAWHSAGNPHRRVSMMSGATFFIRQGRLGAGSVDAEQVTLYAT